MVKENTMKQTEIGLLPEDWDVVRIIEVANKVTDGTHDTPKQVGKGVPFLTAIHIKSNWIDYKGAYFLPELVHRQIFARCNPEKGDVLMVNIGAGAGNCALNIVDYEFSLKNVALIKPDNKKANGSFLNQWQNFNRENILNTIITGGAQPFLSLNQISNLQIPLPPLPEQEAIAEALSDADAWIESLEQLIAKKRLIKQGAMQELLSPKADWEVKKLGEVGKIYGGLSGKTKQDFGSGNSYYIPFMNVMKNVVTDKNFVEKVNLKQGETQNRVLKNDLLFNGSSETPEELGISSVLLDDIDNLYLNSFCFGFRIFDENVSPIFLSYIMRSPYGREVIFYLAQGATRYNLSKANFFNLEIAFPKSLTEQTHIATILSDMDAELEALEAQLGKARKVKQGMMQELLTGKTRLV